MSEIRLGEVAGRGIGIICSEAEALTNPLLAFRIMPGDRLRLAA